MNMIEEKRHTTVSSPVCPVCVGAGRLRVAALPGNPSFGRSVPCPCSEALLAARRLRQRRQAANLDDLRHCTFSTFNPRLQGVQEAFRVCAEFALHPHGWLLLLGPCGCGKTHLAASLAHQRLDSGAEVFFIGAPDLLDLLRAAMSTPARYTRLFEWVREVELLVLDDLGAHSSSVWSTEKFLQILDVRASSALPTVITAIPKEFQGLDERLRSRLSDPQLVTSVLFEKARDYRPCKIPQGRSTRA
jgi:DNA replication protein DnaC